MPQEDENQSTTQSSPSAPSPEDQAWRDSMDTAIEELAQAERRASKALYKEAQRYRPNSRACEGLQLAAGKLDPSERQEVSYRQLFVRFCKNQVKQVKKLLGSQQQSDNEQPQAADTPLATALKEGSFSYDENGWRQFNDELQKAKRRLKAFYTIHIESNGIDLNPIPSEPEGSRKFLNKKLARYIRRLRRHGLNSAIKDLTDKAVNDDELANTELLIENNKHQLFQRAFEEKKQLEEPINQTNEELVIQPVERLVNCCKYLLGINGEKPDIDDTCQSFIDKNADKQLSENVKLARKFGDPKELQNRLKNCSELRDFNDELNTLSVQLYKRVKQYLKNDWTDIDEAEKNRLAYPAKRKIDRLKAFYSEEQLQSLANNSKDLADISERIDTALFFVSKKPFKESRLVEQALNESPSSWNLSWRASDKWRDKQKPLADYTDSEKQLRLIQAKEILRNTYQVGGERIQQILPVEGHEDNQAYSVKAGQLTLDEAIKRLEKEIDRQRLIKTKNELNRVTQVFTRLGRTVGAIAYKILPNGYRDFNYDSGFAKKIGQARQQKNCLIDLGLLDSDDHKTTEGLAQSGSNEQFEPSEFYHQIKNKLKNGADDEINAVIDNEQNDYDILNGRSKQQFIRELDHDNNNRQAALLAYIFEPYHSSEFDSEKLKLDEVGNRWRQYKNYLDSELISELKGWRDGWLFDGYVTDADIANVIKKVYSKQTATENSSSADEVHDGTTTDEAGRDLDDLYAIRRGIGDKLYEQTYLFYKHYRDTGLTSESWGRQGRKASHEIYDLVEQLHRIKMSLGDDDVEVSQIVDSLDKRAGIDGLLRAGKQIHVKLAEHYQEASKSKSQGRDDELKDDQSETLEKTKKLINRISYRYTGRKYIYDLHHYFKCPYSREQAQFLQDVMTRLNLNPDHVVLPGGDSASADNNKAPQDTFSLIESRLGNNEFEKIREKLKGLKDECYKASFKDRQDDIEARRTGYANTKYIKSYLTLTLAVLTTAGEVGMQVNMAVSAMALFFSPPTAVLAIAGSTIAVCAVVSNFRLLRLVINTAFNTFIYGLYSTQTGRRLNNLAQGFIGGNVLTATIVGTVLSGLSWYQGHGLWVNTLMPKALSFIGATGSLLALGGPIGHSIAALIAVSSFIFFMSSTLYSYIEVGSYLNERHATISSVPNIIFDMITGFLHSYSVQAFTENLYGLAKGQGKTWSQASRQELKKYICNLVARLTMNVGVIALVIGFPLMANTVELGASIQSLQGMFHNVAEFLGSSISATAGYLTAASLACIGVAFGDLVFDWNMMSKIFGRLVPSYQTLQNGWSTIANLGRNIVGQSQQSVNQEEVYPDNTNTPKPNVANKLNNFVSATSNVLTNCFYHPLSTFQYKIWPKIQIPVLYAAAAINALSYASMTFTTWPFDMMGILFFGATGSASFAGIGFSINEDFSSTEASTSWSHCVEHDCSPTSQTDADTTGFSHQSPSPVSEHSTDESTATSTVTPEASQPNASSSHNNSSNDPNEQTDTQPNLSSGQNTVTGLSTSFWLNNKVRESLEAMETRLSWKNRVTARQV